MNLSILKLFGFIENICLYKFMDEEVFEKAKEEDLGKDEAEELQEIVDETGLDVDDAFEIWEAM